MRFAGLYIFIEVEVLLFFVRIVSYLFLFYSIGFFHKVSLDRISCKSTDFARGLQVLDLDSRGLKIERNHTRDSSLSAMFFVNGLKPRGF